MDGGGRNREPGGEDGQDEHASLGEGTPGESGVGSGMSRDAAALVAHEIRGPIGVIQGYVSMLLDGSVEGRPDHRMAAEMIAKKVHDLSMLFDALVVSLAGRDGREPVDLGAVVRLAAERMEDRALLEASSVVTVGDNANEEPIIVQANRAHLLCILTCLISNALVYSPRGSRVEVELRDGDQASVAVQDYGYGIPASRLDHVFERECRLCEGVDGFGLGLTLSRDLAERNGGTLELESSEVGRGSTFVLALPRVGLTSQETPEENG